MATNYTSVYNKKTLATQNEVEKKPCCKKSLSTRTLYQFEYSTQVKSKNKNKELELQATIDKR